MILGKSDDAFLGVAKSATGQRWIERLLPSQRNTALAIAQTIEQPDLIGRVLAARGITLEDVRVFLDPSLRELMPDPSVLTDMDAATTRIAQAITNSEQVAIFGDYDVDGACSSALMYKFLAHFGLKPIIHIPDRIFEGYGPNIAAITQLVERGAKLIITVDCGATSFEALEEAKKLGVDVVVLDHHQMNVELPKAGALVNPNRQDDLSGVGHLCAAGVVFLTLVSVSRELRTNGRSDLPNLLDWLDLVALATVCDVVPLKGLNRAFVVKGLQVMSAQQNTGLRSLMRIARSGGPPNVYQMGFVLGPRINAGGRIGDAALGSKLLICEDEEEAQQIAEQLDALNAERQKAEATMLEEAMSEVEREFDADSAPPIILASSNNWHPGIVGLLAARLKERFKRPAIAISFERNGRGAGSGRSVSGVDLGVAVRAAGDDGLLEKGGGHAMAAGLTIAKDRLGELRAYLEEKLRDNVETAVSERSLKIDGALTARSATLDLVEQLEKAGPFGQGHPQPIFVFPAHQIRYAKIVGRDHVSFSASAGDGAQVRGIAFRAAETQLGQLLLQNNGQPIHLAGTLNADLWQGTKRIQLRLTDAALADR